MVWASGEALKLIAEARIFRPALVARFVLNRCAARTLIARATAERLVDHDPPALASRMGLQRVGSVREVAARRPPRSRGSRYEPARFQTRLRGPSQRRRSLGAQAGVPAARDAERSLYTARLTIDVTPRQRGRIKVAAFQRGLTVADMAHARSSRANSPNMMEVRNDGKLTLSLPNRVQDK